MKLYTMTGSRYGSRCLIQIAAKGCQNAVVLVRGNAVRGEHLRGDRNR